MTPATIEPSPEFLAAAQRIKACPCRILGKRPCKACREDARPSLEKNVPKQIKLSRPQLAVLRALAERPQIPDGGASVLVLQRHGFITPLLPIGTGWQITDAGRAWLAAQ